MQFQSVLDMAGVLRTHVPFFTEGLSTVPIIASSNTNLAATTGTEILFNCAGFDASKEEFGADWFETDQLAVALLLLHELSHIIWKHHARRGDKDHSTWNDAADYITHDLLLPFFSQAPFNLSQDRLKKLEHTLHTVFLYDPKYHGWTAEEVYNDLIQHKNPKPNPMPNDIQGEGASTMPQDMRNLINNTMSNYVDKHSGKMPGKGTGGRESVSATTPPPVSMRDVLKCIHDADVSYVWDYRFPGKDDMWRRDGGRMPVPCPSAREKCKHILVGIDSSGSFTDEQIGKALALLRDTFRFTRRPVRVLSVNTSVTDKGLINHGASVSVEENGGTHLACMIDWIKTNHVVPSVVILLTDGEDSYDSIAKFAQWDLLPKLRTVIFNSNKEVANAFPGRTYWCNEV